MGVAVFWYRRDLRLEDNTALNHSLNGSLKVLPIFIFDENILRELPVDDARVQFIHQQLVKLNQNLLKFQSSILCLKGKPIEVWQNLIETYDIENVYINKDYEPYAIKRDKVISEFLSSKGISIHSFKDQVIFEESEIVKKDGLPYTVFTPYKNKWLEKYKAFPPLELPPMPNFYSVKHNLPSLEDIGFKHSSIYVRDYDLTGIDQYDKNRNYPYLDSTSYISPHLRFGTVGIRSVIAQLKNHHTTFLSELIWREFFMQILFHFPHVVNQNFKSKYDGIEWLNNESDFEKWCRGMTGYPMVDAGMRQLNASGYMHNRVRMITSGFLCKHLLIDWRWGESYFAKKLLDYELSSNNGNWQWAAGTGCDAAPYFRIFNPIEQLKKFDPNHIYIKRWIPEWNSSQYPQPMVDHRHGRIRALETYKAGINKIM
ncbi:cryptochrome/photolyase family protein [Membranihabitans marinus]|uniref:cryptochrome/photolyase family protein n=1 Tax=Membranihabitans marinus TaxID=1227546 RepID=UPI001F250439|nr:deoxyribodipyrimidine photo-lyase [Membranihabitans marinus]